MSIEARSIHTNQLGLYQLDFRFRHKRQSRHLELQGQKVYWGRFHIVPRHGTLWQLLGQCVFYFLIALLADSQFDFQRDTPFHFLL